jgi:hypothetical protein
MNKNINYQEKYKELSMRGFCIIKNFIPKNEFEDMRKYWLDFFLNKRLLQPIKNIHKTGITLGDSNYLAYSNDNKIKMLRNVEYLWNKTENALTKKYSIELNKIRNNLLGKDENYGLNFSENNISMLHQINYYPPTAGFMYAHKDGTQKLPMINITFNLTFKGSDFDQGGIELTTKKNEVINLDEQIEPGDVVIFDGNLKHEVKKIQSSKHIGRIGVFPLIVKFYHPQEIPHFLKKISHSYYAIKRRISFKKKPKLPNEV